MSIINRRNAIFGWLAWNVAKQVGKRQASSRLQGSGNGDGHATRNGISAAVAAGIAASVGALIFWRRRRDAGDTLEDVQ
jgi:hypothetical protein